jgi:hypothetical protein
MLAENTGVKSSLTEEETKEYVMTEKKVKRVIMTTTTSSR